MSETLTAAEAAKILKVSKYTLYELVKRGEIPAHHIGRQLRINPSVLEQYLHGTASGSTSQSTITQNSSTLPMFRFIGSHDPVVELLFEFLKHASIPVESSISFKGSMDGLIALYRREADISGVHLWDESSKDYNIPFVKHVLPGESFCIVNLVQREQGFIVAPGNPLHLQAWEDITLEGLQFINRQKGSGTRLRLDAFLKSAKISPGRILGYENEETTHSGVACLVASGQADVGVGVKSAAQRLGLGFIPLFHERYDLVCLGKTEKSPVWRQLLEVLRSPGFIQAINQQQGYDTSLTGKIILKT
ncbi:DNA-binding protein, excisionase family [Desulfosporosinus orientis DSM 765]|uniref:DNA-binding protein, excisionase family n=1 Tax=Desulfosporosinus orientis (strain ATCC 19365 / DSM 765 / NCIMB 8382 / VKM B-1628 / Singapore I) TaxID=768706 RepID=G7WER6_DESOD|nr:helix-turn-helix transcriptional regulator [Desulfosporosinus orientis]AET66957.1 DNA-binding protein, excisionase family [Desulfosporosinus orientis DSM 765]